MNGEPSFCRIQALLLMPGDVAPTICLREKEETMTMRTIKPSRVGTLRKAEVRSTIRGVHVLCEKPGSWEVRLFAPTQTTRFASKKTAVSYATKMAKVSGRKLFVHDGPKVEMR